MSKDSGGECESEKPESHGAVVFGLEVHVTAEGRGGGDGVPDRETSLDDSVSSKPPLGGVKAGREGVAQDSSGDVGFGVSVTGDYPLRGEVGRVDEKAEEYGLSFGHVFSGASGKEVGFEVGVKKWYV